MNEETLRVVREVLGLRTQEPRLHSAPPDEVSLQALAIPSVDMIGIIIDLEDRFGRPIDDSKVYELRTLGDLVRALDSA